MNLIGVLEGILFVVGDEGITLNQICDILNVDIEKAKEIGMQGFVLDWKSNDFNKLISNMIENNIKIDC